MTSSVSWHKITQAPAILTVPLQFQIMQSFILFVIYTEPVLVEQN
jgi:hypothetical protein